jgi:hypothetical protein
METPKILTPFIDYVPFISKKDCYEKIKYYLNNESEREEISQSGYRKSQFLFSSKRFWLDIFDYIDLGNSYNLNIKNWEKEDSISNYWCQALVKRTFPKFSLNYYKAFPLHTQAHYFAMNFISLNKKTHALFRVYVLIHGIIVRILVKIYRLKISAFIRHWIQR